MAIMSDGIVTEVADRPGGLAPGTRLGTVDV